MSNPPTFSVAAKADGGARAVKMHFEGYITVVGQMFHSKKDEVWKGYLSIASGGGWIEAPAFAECKEAMFTAAEEAILRMADAIRDWRAGP